VCHDFDSRPYKKCAHFAHFFGNPCRVGRDLWGGQGQRLHDLQGRQGAEEGAGEVAAPGSRRADDGGRPSRGGLPCTTTAG
jgi:hypothetical protein